MNLVEVIEMFPTQTDCIAYLERLRWAGSVECPHCASTHVRKRNEDATGRIGRYNCHECKSTFKVTYGEPPLSRDEDTPTEVVSGDLADGKCQEKSFKLPTRTRFRVETENGMVSHDEDTC